MKEGFLINFALSPESLLFMNYSPVNKVRIVTAASLFDGHDAAINVMRRIMQSKGAEIIHYAMSPHEQYFLARSEGAVGVGFEKQERVEGSIVRVVYKAPLATTAAEIFRSPDDMKLKSCV